jgi:hypothetical protein
MNLIIKVDPAPAGYRYTGEYRRVAPGEHYAYEGESHKCYGERGCYLILEKVEPKRESRWRLLPALHSSPVYSYLYATLADARRAIGCNHNGEFLRMERLDYEDGKLVAVTLEPEGEEA